MPEDSRSFAIPSTEELEWLVEHLDEQARQEFLDALLKASYRLSLEPKSSALVRDLHVLFHRWLISTRLRQLPGWQQNMAASAGPSGDPPVDARPMTEEELSELLNL